MLTSDSFLIFSAIIIDFGAALISLQSYATNYMSNCYLLADKSLHPVELCNNDTVIYVYVSWTLLSVKRKFCKPRNQLKKSNRIRCKHDHIAGGRIGDTSDTSPLVKSPFISLYKSNTSSELNSRDGWSRTSHQHSEQTNTAVSHFNAHDCIRTPQPQVWKSNVITTGPKVIILALKGYAGFSFTGNAGFYQE